MRRSAGPHIPRSQLSNGQVFTSLAIVCKLEPQKKVEETIHENFRSVFKCIQIPLKAVLWYYISKTRIRFSRRLFTYLFIHIERRGPSSEL